MKQYWDNLSNREQLILLGGGVILLLMLYFVLVINPLNKGLKATAQQIEQQQRAVAWMQQAKQEVQSLSRQHDKNTVSSGSLFANVDKKVRLLKLKQALKRLEPSDENKVRLWFEGASFTKLTQLLAQLQQQENTQVNSLTITRTNQTGLVDAKIVVSRFSTAP